VAALASGGCVERLMAIKSDPPGASVTLDDVSYGVTPVEIPYLWYGKRVLTVQMSGYIPVREVLVLNPPWWQYFPMDFTTDVLLPFTVTDRSQFTVTLEKAVLSDSEREAVLKRAAELRDKADHPK
jgi:hypothetical protein